MNEVGKWFEVLTDEMTGLLANEEQLENHLLFLQPFPRLHRPFLNFQPVHRVQAFVRALAKNFAKMSIVLSRMIEVEISRRAVQMLEPIRSRRTT
jgi:hypothetical protein